MPFIRRLLSHKRAMPVFIRQFMSPLRILYDGLCRIKPEYGIKSYTLAYGVYISQMVKRISRGFGEKFAEIPLFLTIWGLIFIRLVYGMPTRLSSGRLPAWPPGAANIRRLKWP